ncbi:MAG: rRNA maturation RNase YbeY [Holosporales bacterium]|nr:rRNA maturation RNase YbeY [Holosporales bacterium]
MSFCKLDIESDQWLTLASARDWQKVANECAFATFEATNWVPRSEVSFLLTDDTVIQQLNAQYRGKNSPTNVLSFPLLSFLRPGIHAEDTQHYEVRDVNTSGLINKTRRSTMPAKVYLLGDVVLSYSAISRELKTLKCQFMDRVFHLMTHGILHLLGYDHENESEAFLMESVEAMVLQKFDIQNPYDQAFDEI